MRVMMLYFEPQILYGIACPKIAEMSGLNISVEDRDRTVALTHPAKQRVYKMASHGCAGKHSKMHVDMTCFSFEKHENATCIFS